MTYSHGSENIINQLIVLHQDGDAMGRAIVDSLTTDWPIEGCLWIEGINQNGRNDSLKAIAAGNGQSASLLPVESAEKILRQPLIQSILRSGEETPQVINLSNLSNGDATVLQIPLGSGLGILTKFQGVVNGLLIVSNDSSYDWADWEKTRLKLVAPLFAIATRLQEINNEQSQPLTLPDAVIDTFSDQTRNPLTRIRTAVELLSQPELTGEKKQSWGDSARQACLDLQEIVNNIINHQNT